MVSPSPTGSDRDGETTRPSGGRDREVVNPPKEVSRKGGHPQGKMRIRTGVVGTCWHPPNEMRGQRCERSAKHRDWGDAPSEGRVLEVSQGDWIPHENARRGF
ncbi:hypothetical protein RRG08_057369 [Elysia crispata]|uniref:Uncharacterized protein n=1 Tax=Elysia crispata TaxID=231223 RepID=A0AAE1CZN0_9GAST|nr:hypothetical protein RRG08_057369 [Elysia crispata]